MRLLTSALKRAHVRAPDASPDQCPIVILLGCNTADAIGVATSFAPKFRRYGAAIVLTTLSKVLGRHAAPVAARLIATVVAHSQQTDSTFGDAMLEIRRSLLAEGLPMVLTLVAYGDADWRIGPASD